MSYFLMILVGAVLVNNFVLSRFLGCCPFLGVSKKTETALGIVLPLITTNCAVLGVAEINCKQGTGFFESVFFSFAAAVGFGFALVIFSGIREKLAHANPPRCFRGIALALVTAGLLSLAFMGFSGLVKLPY